MKATYTDIQKLGFIKQQFRIKLDADFQAFITEHIQNAEDRLREWVGDANYDDADDAVKTRRLLRAEIHLAAVNMMLWFENRYGLTSAAPQEGATVGGNAHAATREYLRTAERAAAPYCLIPIGKTPQISEHTQDTTRMDYASTILNI